MHSFLDRPLRNGKYADEWKPSNPDEVRSNLQQWYAAGRLLFPRESLQSIHDQINRQPKNGEMIDVKGFDEEVYEYRVLTGNTRTAHEPVSWGDEDEGEGEGEGSIHETQLVERVFGRPHICYSAIEHLQRQLDWSLSRSYCSLSIGHWMTRVDEPAPQGDLAGSLELFASNYTAWEQSTTWTQAQATLRSLHLPRKITKVIGMACGRFSISPSEPTGYPRSAVQHALLLTVKRVLQETGMAEDQDVPCYVQDPAYTPTDRAVLQTHGIEVVEDPEGFLLMDESSVVFSCAPNICVKQIVADIARPAVLIWCRVEEDDPKYSSTDPNSRRVREMVAREYEELPFPEDENFTKMAIYAITPK